MQLKEIAAYLGIDITNSSFPDIPIKGLQYDSRLVQPEDLFVALTGSQSDGHDYIEAAVAKGAAAVLLERRDVSVPPGVPALYCDDTRRMLALLTALKNNFPDRGMRVIGVTGTNGKTTTTHLIKRIWELEGAKVGLIGTIHNYIGDVELPSTHTTPEPLALSDLLVKMRDSGCNAVVMEVSSHALAQQRVAGMHFDGAVFTNLTQDHLDFHGSLDNYMAAKGMLFEYLGKGLKSTHYGVINADDPHAAYFIQHCPVQVITYGMTAAATLQAVDYQVLAQGTAFTLCYEGKRYPVQMPLSGKFNVYNTLAAIGVLLAEGLPLENILQHLAEAPQVAGRFERVEAGQPFAVVVDYAHTPDGLENLLTTARGITQGRIITVFGCGGDRDRTKRPIMGRIAGRYSDYSVITSDNPRTEDPDAIIQEVEAGTKEVTQNYTVQPSRRQAIETAIRQAQPGDVVVIAGKGHEDYQLIGGKVLHFDDRETAREILETLK